MSQIFSNERKAGRRLPGALGSSGYQFLNSPSWSHLVVRRSCGEESDILNRSNLTNSTTMAETASFVDPVFLARFGLSRANVLDYFLHPLNPFRTKANTSNEVLSMQGINIGMLMAQGTGAKPPPLTLSVAEEEYALALKHLTGEQYELLPPPPDEDPNAVAQSPMYTIRHVLRSNQAVVKVLGIYYVLEGVIYKSPTVRGSMKANVARTVGALSDACDALSTSAR